MRKGTSKFHPFDVAKELIRNECLGSKRMFFRWYKHNKPAKIPERPDIIYKNKGWISWNDFLGNNNTFAHTKKNCLPFEEARKFVRTLGLETLEDWRVYVKSGNKPENIPARPDYFYRDEWFTWKDFLRGSIKEIVHQTTKIVPLLYIIKVPGTPPNVVKINVTNGGKHALLEAQQKGAKIIAAFEYTRNLDWRAILSKYANNYYYGEPDDYTFSMNAATFMFELGSYLTQVKF